MVERNLAKVDVARSNRVTRFWNDKPQEGDQKLPSLFLGKWLWATAYHYESSGKFFPLSESRSHAPAPAAQA